MYGLFAALAIAGSPVSSATLELRALKKADQAARQFTTLPTIDVLHRMESADRAREERVRQLLRKDEVLTGEDLDIAALILQHGSDPDDYMLARELSILAFAKGRPGTLQTAAEDRFLLSIRRKQRFGNQFGYGEGGKLVFRELDEEAPLAVTETLRAEFVLAPVKMIREKGLSAIGEAIKPLVERFKRRTDPKWIAEMDGSPDSRELASMAAKHAEKDYDYRAARRVLSLFQGDKLATPSDFHHAASVLATSSEARMILLANELAALAVSRGRNEARKTFAKTWDKFLVVIGKPDRYGTISGAHRVSPVVARGFGLGSLPASQAKPKPPFLGVRYRFDPKSRSGRDS